jgi:hypothetical protein
MNRTVMPNLFNAWGSAIDTRDGAKAALRWMIDPKLGLPHNHFKVWHLPQPETKGEGVDPLFRQIRPGEALYTWPGSRAAAMVRVTLDIGSGQVRIRAHSGPSGSGQVADEERVTGPGTGVGVTLSGPSLKSVTVHGDARVTGMMVLDLHRHVNDPGWKLLELVGLPVDERFDPEYPLDPQGPPGDLVEPREAAIRRVKRGTPVDFWPSTTDTGLSVPPFEPPDPETLVFDELKPTMEQLAEMLRRTGDRSRHAAVLLEERAPGPKSVHGVDAPEHWQSTSKTGLPPLQAALLAAGTDPYAALALGFGTSIDGADLLTASPAFTHRTTKALGIPLMVTLEHKTAFEVELLGIHLKLPFEHDLAALVTLAEVPPRSPRRLRANDGRDRPRLDRPAAVDRPWLEIVDLTWDADRTRVASVMGPTGYGVLRSVGGASLKAALDKRRSGGPRIFVPGLNGDRVRFTESAVPERMEAESGESRFAVASQDWFGRWSAWTSLRHERVVVPPQRPTVRRVKIDETGPSPELAVEFTWDWADRRPAQIQIRVKAHPEGEDPPPVDGSVLSPGGPSQTDLVIPFEAVTPDAIPPALADILEEVVEERQDDLRTYRVVIPGLALPYATHQRIRVQAQARATERVRRSVHSGFSAPVGTSAYSPIPPPAPITTAQMRWTSLPDAAGVARAVVTWAGSGPTYTVYIADESAVARELGLPSPDLDTPPAERLAALRLEDFGRARRAFRRHAEGLTDPRLEVALPRGSRLIHFYGIGAVSETGIERPLPADANQYLAVAPPTRLVPPAPRLTARPDGTATRLAVSVDAGPVPVDRVELGRVRGKALAGSTEAAGAPIIIADASTATLEDGTLHWELTDTEPLPPWEPVFYRATATAVAEPARGRLAGRSHPTSAVEVVVPSAAGPTLTDLTVTPTTDGTGGLVVGFRTDASRLRTRLGAFSVSVVAVHAAAGLTTATLRAEYGSLKSYTGAPPPDAPDLFLLRATAADPYRVTARIAETPASVSADVTDPLGRRTSSVWSAP